MTALARAGAREGAAAPSSRKAASRPGPEEAAEGGGAHKKLRSYVDRLERVQEEIDGLNGDKRDIYAEAKGNGFDTKVMKQVIKLRRIDAAERQEQEAILDLYLHALGMAPDETEADD